MRVLRYFILSYIFVFSILNSRIIIPDYAEIFPSSWQNIKQGTLAFDADEFAAHTKLSYPKKECSITIDPVWVDLENSHEKSEKFESKWILAGKIIFKKKCNKPVHINELKLCWHGSEVNHLSGSLFMVKNTDQFKPLNENHIADSSWAKESKTLRFKFGNAFSLHPKTEFFLVLTVPKELEHSLKGYFTIQPNCLPQPFQGALSNENIALHIDAHDVTIQ